MQQGKSYVIPYCNSTFFIVKVKNPDIKCKIKHSMVLLLMSHVDS